jgi:hypothetical protein
VGWATALLAVVLVVLGTSYVLGLLAPRVSTDHGVSTGVTSGADDTVYAMFEVRNEAYATARLAGADASVPGMRVAFASVAPLHGGTARADGAVDLRHGERAQVTILWQVTDCGLVPADPEPIALDMRTPLGLARRVDARAVSELLGASTGASPADEPDPGWARALARRVCATGPASP